MLIRFVLLMLLFFSAASITLAADDADRATHESDHAEDNAVIQLDPIHIHGLPLNRDRQKGPVTDQRPFLEIPSSLAGHEIDDWMKVRVLVDKTGQATVVVLEPAKHREINLMALATIQKWRWESQLKIDEPVDGETTVRIHFRTQ